MQLRKKELPFVVGLMSDLSGDPVEPLPKLRDRRFVEIDRDNFNEVMEKITPRLDLKVSDVMKGEGDLKIELEFKEFGDFHPEAIVKKIPRLAKLLEARQNLRDLLSKLDGNDDLNDLLSDVVGKNKELKEVKAEVDALEKNEADSSTLKEENK
jgi:type VI secretion system protein ImpB